MTNLACLYCPLPLVLHVCYRRNHRDHVSANSHSRNWRPRAERLGGERFYFCHYCSPAILWTDSKHIWTLLPDSCCYLAFPPWAAARLAERRAPRGSLPEAQFGTDGGSGDPAATRAALADEKAYSYTSGGFITSLPAATRHQVVDVYAKALQVVWLIVAEVSCLGFLCVFWEKHAGVRKEYHTECGLAEDTEHIKTRGYCQFPYY